MTSKRLILGLLTAFSLVNAPLPVRAQSRAPLNLVGVWDVDAGGPVGKCQVELQSHTFAGHLAARSIMCIGALAFVNGWTPDRNGFILIGIDGRQIASFAPARGIMNGRLADGSLVIMQQTGGQRTGAMQPPPGDGTNPCYIREDTGRCVRSDDTVAPRGPHPVRVLITGLMNIRRERSLESQVVGQVKPGQCIIVNACFDTKWGVRCEIPMDRGATRGFILKYYEKNGRDYVGFVNRC
ncbi:MAG: AprI/Inh family metalloprotease inhibitor [Rhizobium sp.]